jgi:hypothetical protein
MIRIDMTPEEAEILRVALESYLSDLRVEVSNTDRREYREALKHAEAILKKLLRDLEIVRPEATIDVTPQPPTE